MGAAVGGGKGPRSDINITPLVDIVLVLLIIFMVLTPLMEKELAVRVPETDEVTPPPPPDEKIDQYIFRVDEKGKFFINSEALTDENASDRLKVYYHQAKANEAKNGPPVIFFEADDKTKYVRAVNGLDKIKDSSAGWTIGMMTEKMTADAVPGTPGAPAVPGAPAAPASPAPAAPPK